MPKHYMYFQLILSKTLTLYPPLWLCDNITSSPYCEFCWILSQLSPMCTGFSAWLSELYHGTFLKPNSAKQVNCTIRLRLILKVLELQLVTYMYLYQNFPLRQISMPYLIVENNIHPYLSSVRAEDFFMIKLSWYFCWHIEKKLKNLLHH